MEIITKEMANMSNEKTLKKDFISVVMSNYNTPIKYLKESIDSVLNQTYSNFEFIIIDDSSTDDSLEFIKSYDDPRIKLIVNEENIGLTKSLNKGFEVAQCEFIARMDSDDICYPERFEKQIAYMKEHPDTIVCGTWADIIDENGVLREGDWTRKSIEDMEQYKINLLFCNYPVVLHPSVLFNHALLNKYCIKYNNTYRYAQDYDMWTQCSKYANCFIIQETLLQYRIHNNSITCSKRDYQKKYVFQIVQIQLSVLHLQLPNNIKDAHILFPKGEAQFSITLKKWIKQIINANKKYQVFNHKKIKKILWYYWSKTCYAELSHSSAFKRLTLIISLSPRCIINLFRIKKYYINKRKR